MTMSCMVSGMLPKMLPARRKLISCTGTPEPKNIHAEGGSHDHEDVGPAMLQTDPASETGKKQGGVMKQIL